MPTYVLATITGREEKTKKLIEEITCNARLFIPQKITVRKYEGAWHEEIQKLFPGYIFVETDDIAAFVDTLPKSFFNTFMKVIGKNDQLYLSVKDEELAWLRKLCGDDFTATLSKGIKENGKIRFTSGPLVGMEGLVRKVDRHRRIVTLEIEMFGRVQHINLGAEILNAAEEVEEE